MPRIKTDDADFSPEKTTSTSLFKDAPKRQVRLKKMSMEQRQALLKTYMESTKLSTQEQKAGDK